MVRIILRTNLLIMRKVVHASELCVYKLDSKRDNLLLVLFYCYHYDLFSFYLATLLERQKVI